MVVFEFEVLTMEKKRRNERLQEFGERQRWRLILLGRARLTNDVLLGGKGAILGGMGAAMERTLR